MYSERQNKVYNTICYKIVISFFYSTTKLVVLSIEAIILLKKIVDKYKNFGQVKNFQVAGRLKVLNMVARILRSASCKKKSI